MEGQGDLTGSHPGTGMLRSNGMAREGPSQPTEPSQRLSPQIMEATERASDQPSRTSAELNGSRNANPAAPSTSVPMRRRRRPRSHTVSFTFSSQRSHPGIRRQTPTSVSQVARQFAAIELRRLRLEEQRERNRHELELSRLQLERERLRQAEDNTNALRRIEGVAQAWLDYCTGHGDRGQEN